MNAKAAYQNERSALYKSIFDTSKPDVYQVTAKIWQAALQGYLKASYSYLSLTEDRDVVARLIFESDPVQQYSILRELSPIQLNEVELDSDKDTIILFLRRQLRAFQKKVILNSDAGNQQMKNAYHAFVKNQRRLVPFNTPKNPAFQKHEVLLNTAEYLIWRSGVNDLDDFTMLDSFKVGPGSTIGCSGGDASLFRKLFDSDLTGTSFSKDYIVTMLKTYDDFGDLVIDRIQSSFVECDYEETLFVDKDNDEKRTIAKTGTISGICQQALGSHLNSCLRKVGIDLKGGQIYHRDLARRASLGELDLCTMDLSKASDSVCTELVRRLFRSCPQFMRLADGFSTRITRMPDNTEVPLQCYSTMGNAFTFPLQTLVFWSLLRAVCPKGIVRVYGDDLIFPTKYYSKVREVLSDFGFLVNEKKSFHNGGFRESCGGDYFHGIDVRPFFIKNAESCSLNGIASYICTTINGLTSTLGRFFDEEYVFSSFSELFTVTRAISTTEIGSKCFSVVPNWFPSNYGLYMSPHLWDVQCCRIGCTPPTCLPEREFRFGGVTRRDSNPVFRIRALQPEAYCRTIEHDHAYFIFRPHYQVFGSSESPPVVGVRRIRTSKGVEVMLSVSTRFKTSRYKKRLSYIPVWMWDNGPELLSDCSGWEDELAISRFIHLLDTAFSNISFDQETLQVMS